MSKLKIWLRIRQSNPHQTDRVPPLTILAQLLRRVSRAVDLDVAYSRRLYDRVARHEGLSPYRIPLLVPVIRVTAIGPCLTINDFRALKRSGPSNLTFASHGKVQSLSRLACVQAIRKLRSHLPRQVQSSF